MRDEDSEGIRARMHDEDREAIRARMREGISKARGVQRRQRRVDSSTLRSFYTKPHGRNVVSGAS